MILDLLRNSFHLFFSFFFVSDVTSGEVVAGLLPGSEMLVKSLEQGGFEAVEIWSGSDSSELLSVSHK